MRIDHIALPAEDPEALSAWYAKWFGFREERRLESPSRPPIVFLSDEAGQALEIVPGQPSPWLRPNGFAFHVAFLSQDIDGAMERLEPAGIRIVDRRTTSVGWKIAYFYDPAGNLLEIVQRGSEETRPGGQR